MKKPPIHIEDCSKIELHIHVLGYFPKGESILIVLWDGNDKSVLRSIMVDCFKQENTNRLYSILAKYKLDKEKLDFVVWTHPDLDHSLGISEVIANYTDSKTNILIPVGLKRELFKSPKSELFKSAYAVFQKSWRDKDTVIPISTSGLFTNTPTISDHYQDGVGDGFWFSIEVLAPFSEHSFRWTEVLKSLNKNDISIAFNVRFGSYRFFFGGDAMNYSLSKMDEDRLSNTLFVKIPHHGSSTSECLPILYKKVLNRNRTQRNVKKTMVAVTTTFEEHPSHLPEQDVLDKYKCISKKIFHTSKTPQIEKYGICSFVYKYNSRVPSESFSGDSSICYEM